MATNSKFNADLGIKTDADLQVDGNVTVSGNLTVNGTQTTVNSTTTSVEDSMLELANQNLSSDTLDIGIYGNYDDGLGDGTSEYTGFFRDATDSTWKLFDGLESEPTTTVNTSGSGYTLADLQVGDLTATTLTATNSLTGSSITYPTSDGTNGQVLTTNGSGTLSFTDMSSGADGITASGSNTIIQSPDDTNVIHVNNSARVGVGTSNPTKGKIEISGSSYDEGILIERTDTSSRWGLSGSDSGSFQIWDDNQGDSTRLVIDSSGDVLIGQTSQTGYTFAQKLVVGDGDDNDGITIQSGATHQGNIAFNKGGGTTAEGRISYQHDSNYMSFFTNNTERMRIGNDGKTSFTPTTSTDNYGFEVITGNSADTGIKIGRTGTNNAMFGLAVSSNGTNSKGRIQFDGDGDVSFGDAANIELRDGNLVRIQQAFSNPTYATNRAVYAEDQGELGYNASVRASKTNIADVGDVSWLYNLNAKTFNKRKKIQGEKQSDGTFSYSYSDTEHSGITEYGFIAEDLEALAPELCFYEYTRDVDADGNELDTFTKGELQGVHYDSMVAPMLKLIQNQKDEIDALEARIATLESS